MDRAEKRRQQKLVEKAKKSAGHIKPNKGPPQHQQKLPNFHSLDHALDHAMSHHEAGRISEAEDIYLEVLKVEPIHPVAKNLLSVIAYQKGNKNKAWTLITQAIATAPDYPEAHLNLGNLQKDLGRLEDAVASYQKAIAIRPEYAEAHYRLGMAFQDLGKFVDAVANCQQAIAIRPDYADAHNNLGNGLLELGKLDKAEASYRKALAIKPDLARAHNNLGILLNELGRLGEAIASFQNALALRPDYSIAWWGVMRSIKALRFLEARENLKNNSYIDGFSPAARATPDFAILEYYLDSFRPHEADKNFSKALSALPAKTNEEITISETDYQSESSSELPDKMVALLHFGRSGTGLLHSLIDSHPEISTLPSIYLRGYFNADVWSKISSNGWRRLPERFADEFAVLFDANSSELTPGIIQQEDSSFLGRKEGMTNVGENRNESLSLDRDKFCSEALRLMKGLDKVDPGLFFLVVHAAFEKVLGANTKKLTTFYHIHNPNEFAKLNFLRFFPNARLVMMVREPIQCCESWIRINSLENNYKNIVHRIIAMLFGIDQVAFRKQDSVGVRLEDLKSRPEATIRALCDWLGVEETQSLYQMTAQGKKWWGDPTSPDYDATNAMAPFGEASTNRPVGKIFSEQDQFVLRTLFYPFGVRFGYQEPDANRFARDLKEIRPLFKDMLDFEKALSERTEIDPAQFKCSGEYQLLRAGLMDRWEVLNELGDYPHMLETLFIA